MRRTQPYAASKSNDPHPTDKGFKAIFSHRRMIIELFQYLLPEESWAKQLQFDSLEKCNNEYTEVEQQRSSDIVWKAKLGERDVYIYIFMELQSRNERMMALRMLNYSALLQMDILKQQPDTKALTPVFPLVLYTGLSRWNAPTQLSDLFPDMPDELKQWQPHIQFKLIDEHRIMISESQHQQDLALIELLILAEQAKGWPVMRRVVSELREKLNAEHIDPKDTLVKAVSYRLNYLINHRITGNTEAPTFTTSEPATTLEEVSDMLDQTEHIDWYASAVEDGRSEGFENGRSEGIVEGIEQGEQKILLGLLNKRFGSDSPLPLWALNKVQNANSQQIEQWSDRLFSAKALEDVLSE